MKNGTTSIASYGQEGLFSLEQIEDTRHTYHILLSAKIISRYSEEHLRTFFEEFIRRHPVCTSQFSMENGTLTVIENPEQELYFSQRNVSSLSEKEIRKLVLSSGRERFDLTTDQLFRVFLFTQSETEAYLLISAHHSISDGLSFGVLLDELKKVYSALVTDIDFKLKPIRRPAHEFAIWQREWVQSAEGEKQRSYWEKRLKDISPTLELPYDTVRTNNNSLYGGDIHYFTIDGERYESVKSFISEHSATALSFFMTVSQIVLTKLTGQHDVLLCHPSSGRMRTKEGRKRADFNNSFGYFVNPLLFGNSVDENQSVEALLAETTKYLKEDFKNQDYPFQEVLKQFNHRDATHPIPQVVLNIQKQRNDHRDVSLYRCEVDTEKVIDLGALQIKPFFIPQQEGSFDLEWELIEADDQFHCNLRYRTDVFTAETIVKYKEYLNSMIDEILTKSDVSIGTLSLIPQREKEKILNEFNSTATDISAFHDKTLADMFEMQVEKTPDRVAVEYNGEELSYRELNDRALVVAYAIQKEGIAKDTIVGLHIDRSIDMIIGLVGILKSGGAYLPIDTTLPEDRKNYMLQNSGSSIVLTTSDSSFSFEGDVTAIQIDTLDYNSSGEEISRVTTSNDLAYVIYTSGSTGLPKGTMLEHLGVINTIVDHIAMMGMNETDIMLQFASLSFDASVLEIFQTLFSGAKLVLVPKSITSNPLELEKFIDEKQITSTVLPPVVLSQLDKERLLSIRNLYTGGEAANYSDVVRFSPGRNYLNVYGPTEASIVTTTYMFPDSAIPLDIPIGKPISNTRMYVLDEQRNLCPIGVEGELYCAGIGVARGYINNPELTAEKFMDDPFVPGERMYKTGDLGKWLPDGNIAFNGRMDYQIKISGYRVELGEIETQLMSIDAVSQAAVVDCTNAAGNKYLSAFITTHSEISEAMLKKALNAHLPYYMVPVNIHFMEDLPLTSNAKIDRKALKAIEEESTKIEPVEFTPDSRVFETTKEIWLNILGLENCDKNENFFDLGGHSLLVVELQTRINREFSLDLPVADLFTYSTLSSLSEYIQEQVVPSESTNSTAILQNRRSDDREDIAVIGMAGRFPGASSIDQFWKNISGGIESISTFTEKELKAEGIDTLVIDNPNYVASKGIIEDPDLFDAHFYKFNPRDAEITDPQQRLFLDTAYKAFLHAGYDHQGFTKPVGVFAGMSQSSYFQQNLSSSISMQDPEYHQVMIGNDKDFLATRVAYKFNLTGPAKTIQTACSSSLVSVHAACESLHQGSSYMALAGGVSITLPMKSGYLYTPDGISSPSGQCRPFDADAKGTVPGNGVAAVLLKRLSDAVKDKDTIYAVIKGSAINNDGSDKVGFTAPSVTGQKEVMHLALQNANVPAESINYIEAHGTGTNLGDPVEFKALSDVYGRNRSDYCRLGSVKSNIGHLDAAAGITGFIKTALSLYNKQIAPTIHFTKPNDALRIEETQMQVASTLIDWKAGDPPRRAAVSSLGLGGTNAHVILEEYLPETEKKSSSEELFLIPLSAPTKEQLETYQTQIAGFIRKSSNVSDVAYTLTVGRHHYPASSFCYVNSKTKILSQWFSAKTTLIDPQLIWVFPGQGTQYVQMGLDLYRSQPEFRKRLDHCLELIDKETGTNFRAILWGEGTSFEEAQRLIQNTRFAQPLLFAISYAVGSLWKSLGVRPQALIGHSFGEFAAAVFAEVLSLEDAVKLITKRGELLESMESGAMLSVWAEESDIQPLLTVSTVISAYNAPGNCVVSGPQKEITQLARKLKGNSIQVVELDVSHGFHSPMMAQAAKEFRAVVESVSLHPPKTTIISTVTGKAVTGAEIISADYWCSHITQPVRFADAIATVTTEDTIFLEVGASNTLSRLIKTGRYKSNIETIASLPHKNESMTETETFLKAQGMLWALHSPISLAVPFAKRNQRRVAVPGFPLNNKSYWIHPSKESSSRPSTYRSNNPKDWIYAPTWIPSLPPNRNWRHDLERCSITWLIFLDKVGLGDELAAKLRSTGQKVIAVRLSDKDNVHDSHYYDSDSFVIDPYNKDEYDAFFRGLVQRNTIPDRILHLPLLTSDSFQDFTEENIRPINYLGFFSMLFIIKAMQKNHIDKPIEFTTITDHIFSVNGEDWINPLKASIQGPITVIPQEHQYINMQHIDVSLNKSDKEIHWLAEFIIQDIINFTPNITLAYRNHRRWERGFERLETDPGEINLKRNGVYLITGGMGDIGLSIAKDFAHNVNATLILIGNTILPERNNWESIIEKNDGYDKALIAKLKTIIEIEEIGCRVILATIDWSDEKNFAKILSRIEEKTGRINGIIHATGTVGNSLISTRTIDDIESMLSPKIQSTMNLELFFKERDLDFFLLFSSVSAITGGIEMVAYSGANAFLDAVAAHNFSDRHLNTLSLNLPGMKKDTTLRRWGEESFRKKFQEQYEANTISSDEVINTLKLCLSLGPTYNLVVSPQDFNKWKEKIMDKETGFIKPEMQDRYERPPLTSDLIAATNSEELYMVDLWETVLNMSPIGVEDNFFELGGHSLLGLELLSRIAEEKKVPLQINDLYDNPTIRDLLAFIDSQSRLDPLMEFNMPTSVEEDLSLITLLQKGTGDKKLFLFQPLGVNVYYYQPLVKHLDDSLTVYAFRISEVEEEKDLPQSIEEIADNCIEMLIKLGNGCQYNLAGASFGGIIAFEVAQKLKERGKDVQLVSLFDSPGPLNLPKMPETDAEILHYIFKQWAPISMQKLDELETLDEQCQYIIDFIQKSKNVQKAIEKEQVIRLLQLFRAGGNALKEYRPSEFDGDLLFLKPLTFHPDYAKYAEQSWKEICQGKIAIHNVPGDHLSMNQEPNVGHISTILNGHLCQ